MSGFRERRQSLCFMKCRLVIDIHPQEVAAVHRQRRPLRRKNAHSFCQRGRFQAAQRREQRRTDGKYAGVETIIGVQPLADRQDSIACSLNARDILDIDPFTVDAPIDAEPRARGRSHVREKAIEGRFHQMVAHREQRFFGPDERLRRQY